METDNDIQNLETYNLNWKHTNQKEQRKPDNRTEKPKQKNKAVGLSQFLFIKI